MRSHVSAAACSSACSAAEWNVDEDRCTGRITAEHFVASHAQGYTLENVPQQDVSALLRLPRETERAFLLRVLDKFLEYHAIIVRSGVVSVAGTSEACA